MSEKDEDRVAAFVDDQLRFLRGEGPEPDVSGLSDDERAEMVELLNLVDAMVDSRPLSPPLEEDPVAVRLGLVPSKPGSPPVGFAERSESADPILIATEELRYRFGGAVEVDHLVPTAGDVRWSPVARCRALAENILVVAFRSSDLNPSASDARVLLSDDPSLTAIAFTTRDAIDAAVVVPGDAVGRLVPADGWVEPGELRWEPLGIALGRHFDRSIPDWDAVTSLPREDLLDDLGADAWGVVAGVFAAAGASRPQLAYKRKARDFVATVNRATVVVWVDGIRSGQVTGADVVSEISLLCQEANP